MRYFFKTAHSSKNAVLGTGYSIRNLNSACDWQFQGPDIHLANTPLLTKKALTTSQAFNSSSSVNPPCPPPNKKSHKSTHSFSSQRVHSELITNAMRPIILR